MANWIQNCQICNDGLCIRMEELKKTGLSGRRAAEVMQEEAYDSYPDLKNEFAASRIRDRYRYHMKGKKLGEIPPQKASWPMCKKCGERPVAENYDLNDFSKRIPAENGLCGGCHSEEERKKKPKCQDCGSTIDGRVYGHGLCKICKSKESREDANTRLKEREKEYDATPVDAETEQFWNDLIEQFEAIRVSSSIPCGKVGDEMLEKIEFFRRQLYGLVNYLNDVVTESEVRVQVQ